VRPALIDDQLLSAVLRHGAVDALQGREVYTTGCWYVRLCRAALGRPESSAVRSGPFASLPHHLRTRALLAVMELPASIGLVSLRHLAPLIGQLRSAHPLNLLGSEALAAATHLQAEVFLSTPSPRLQEALSTEGCVVHLGWRSGSARYPSAPP